MPAPYPPLTVGEATQRIALLLEKTPELQSLVVRGEVREILCHRSGHTYFTLGDAEATLSGVLFKGNRRGDGFVPLAGDEVFVEGRIGVYPPRGVYQIYARRFLPLGKGAKARAKKDVQERLQKEGFFDPRLKRPLPSFPEHVGVVTSSEGAAVRDVIAVAQRRFPGARLYVFPALVQGVGAVSSMLRALRCAALFPLLQVTMLVRGGGGKDELSPFDEEDLVRALRVSPVPILTGIGHQQDLSLADLAADAHAPTPSAAAEFLFPDREDLLLSLEHDRKRFLSLMRYRLGKESRCFLQNIETMQSLFSQNFLRHPQELLQKMEKRLFQAFSYSRGSWHERVRAVERSLQNCSPYTVLSRGYVYCSDVLGEPVFSVKGLRHGDLLSLGFADGTVRVCVVEKRQEPGSED